MKQKNNNEWQERAKNCLAQGWPATNSKRSSQFPEGYPTHTTGGSGCYLDCTDGRQYLDFIGGLGALSLGYSNSAIEEAVIRQAKKGASHSLPTTLEVEVAEILSNFIPCAEKIRFFKNGRDAADCALRIARTSTKKKVVLSDGYHGTSDLFTSLTPPHLGVVDMFHVKQLPLDGSIDWTDVACVIVEAIKLDDSIEYQNWIRELRAQCKEQGAIFILDEIITGFRVPQMCVSNWWSLDPDIILLGKGMANGYPLSAIGGRKEIIDCADWFFSTTFGGEAVSLAACKATIKEIQKRNLEDLMFYGKRLQTKLNELHKEIKFEGYGTRAMLNVSNPFTALFMQEMCKAHFLFGKAHFFNFAHLEANIEEQVVSAAEIAIDKIRSGSIKLVGKMPEEAIKR